MALVKSSQETRKDTEHKIRPSQIACRMVRFFIALRSPLKAHGQQCVEAPIESKNNLVQALTAVIMCLIVFHFSNAWRQRFADFELMGLGVATPSRAADES